ncbi:MAG: L-erythro-3,5-diaminohexanoate dehydrogenase [Acidibacillus sp.]|uniref:L-erythro-3,5-diaminohexanoate dehydrogenase n=1 Tax=Sulfoacidibacillus ferrooxidans TaxID=2005001 RepID=A0A9X2AEP8_9BACL|nr:L-erythro-3,5-diaminohexanoate dehydrogenase [Sulfoacidibacillus ferrooxidans]MCI0183326.1 L-erythro-3,5-diaminohexanoate dehydrogenase [Sulfoacidibacillus ferrooxidans]MCY0893995.1 L-erythro-3,5-diaminohexanoate dehydrogenase [Acidibacillus sp.]
MSDPYGLTRVIEPMGTMPQPAWKIDNTMTCGLDEVLISVSTLNIDSASFNQIKEEVGADETAVASRMIDIVTMRGKHHNPVTGSGGMLIGKVEKIGPESSKTHELHVGDRIATLVSLSLTPLTIDAVKHVELSTGQVEIEGKAILFDSGIYAKMPEDLPDRVALAVFDVCGAPAQTARIVESGQTVVVLGAGGKSGMMVLAQARRNIGDNGRIIALEYAEKSAQGVRDLGFADDVIVCNAQDPVATLAAVSAVLGEHLADVTINCVSVPGTELASIMITKDRGLIYFFSMATSFTTAALGAEGLGKDVDMMIGNGYARGHADLALELVRTEPTLLEAYVQKCK